MKSPVAKHMHKFNRSSVQPNKRRKALEAVVVWEKDENDFQGVFSQGKEVNQLDSEDNAEDKN